MHSKQLSRFLEALPQPSHVLNFGSYDGALGQLVRDKRLAIKLDCCDVQAPATEATSFILLDRNTTALPIATAHYDAIIISHVIEHLNAPIESMREWLRILKPGGSLYIEAPSERSLMGKSHPNFTKHGFFSFWDDPTHIRPWTPAAFYRLAIGYGCDVAQAGYIGNIWDVLRYPFIRASCLITGNHHRLTTAAWKAKKLSCYAIIKKPKHMHKVSDYRYITLQKRD